MDAIGGRVIGLYTAPAAGESMISHASVDLAAGQGIAGDRYLLHTGHWSDPQWPDQEVTLFEAEVAEQLGMAPEAFRRNIVTRGLRVLDLVGVDFGLGSARLRGLRHCDPCRYLDGLTRRGIHEEIAESGGLRCAVLVGGAVELGDRVEV